MWISRLELVFEFVGPYLTTRRVRPYLCLMTQLQVDRVTRVGLRLLGLVGTLGLAASLAMLSVGGTRGTLAAFHLYGHLRSAADQAVPAFMVTMLIVVWPLTTLILAPCRPVRSGHVPLA